MQGRRPVYAAEILSSFYPQTEEGHCHAVFKVVGAEKDALEH